MPPSREISWRNVLHAGSIGAVSAAGPGLLGLRDLIVADQTGQAKSDSVPSKFCIFIYQYGGLSQLDSCDPKPQAPNGIRGPYKPIATRTRGFQVGELMPRLAELSETFRRKHSRC